MNNKTSPIIIILLFFFFVVLGLFFYTEVINKGESLNIFSREDSNKEKNKKEISVNSVEINTPSVLGGDPIIGDMNKSSVQIIMYGDFNCEPCRKAYTVIKNIIRQKEGGVNWVWKTIVNIDNKNSTSFGVASYCAHKQGRFWEFSDYLFTNKNRFSADYYEKYANILNMNSETFINCINDISTKNLVISESNKYQKELKITETPVIYINGKPYSDVLEKSALLNAIKNATNEKK